MSFTYWTYRRPFTIKDQVFEVKIGTRIRDWHTRLLQCLCRQRQLRGIRMPGTHRRQRRPRCRPPGPTRIIHKPRIGWPLVRGLVASIDDSSPLCSCWGAAGGSFGTGERIFPFPALGSGPFLVSTRLGTRLSICCSGLGRAPGDTVQ